MKLVFYATAIILVGLGITACSGAGNVPTTITTSSIVDPSHYSKAKKTGPTLYVMNSGQTAGTFSITIYTSGGTKPLRTISLGKSGKSGSVAFAVDANGLLYESFSQGRSRAILRIYDKRGAKLVDTWSQKEPYGDITPDTSGNIYTTCGITACEYNSAGKVARKFTHSTLPFAVDNAGDVAVSQCGGKFYNGVECIFAPGMSKAYWTAYAGTFIADAGFDPSGNLYVAVAGENGAVEEFAPNAQYATRTLTDGMINPYALAFDSANNAYVLNQGQVTVYPPTGTEPSRTISQGIGGCGLHSICIHPLAIDAGGNLYVANNASNNVTVYAPNGSTPIRTISTGINGPIGLAIGP